MELTKDQLAEYELRATMAERERCAKLVPTTWLDPLLTGPKAVLKHPVDNRNIEALLRAVQARIRNSKS